MNDPDLVRALAQRMAGHRVFGCLDDERRLAFAAAWRVDESPAGAMVLGVDEHGEQTCWLLDGEVELLSLDAQDEAVGLRLGPDELFGYGLAPVPVGLAWPARAVSPCRVARLAPEALDEACVNSPALLHFFPGVADELASVASVTVPGALAPLEAPPPAMAVEGAEGATGADPHLGLMTRPVSSLLRRGPITLPPSASIREAAELMCAQRVSSVLLVEREQLFGLITDRDLRNRVLAQGLDPSRPVMDIATLAPLTIEPAQPAFHALLLMARHNIHHVPVVDGEHVLGMVTATDLTEQHSTSAVYLVGDIHKQSSLEGLRAAAAKVQQLQRSLAAADASAYSSGHIVTAITDAITIRLLQLAEAKLGPPPVDYVWVAAGSQARNEQTAKSDQDNCMILDDRYDDKQHGEYFEALSREVCDGLNACGYVYCPGEMMAMTAQWRQPQRRWRQYFRHWTQEPEPKALMLTCVFFDLRAIYGKASLLEEIRHEVLESTRGNGIFLAYMVSNALSRQPPLGLFGQISTARSGEHRGTVDLKHLGIVPVVDLARVYALAGASEAVNTHDRLMAAAAGGEVSEGSARDLREALEFLAALRIRHQARQMAAGEKPDNYLRPDTLSNFERTQLKDAFNVVQKLQSVLSQRYTAGRF